MPWRTLLAADDGTPAGRHATDVAGRLASRLGSAVSVVRVEPTGNHSGATPDLEPSMQLRVVQGVPSIEIVRAAEDLGAKLIIMGRSDGVDCRPRLGSTADGVVRRSLVPTLFVIPGQQEFARVAIALDGTDRGNEILKFSEPLGHLGASSVEILTVEPVPESSAAPVPGGRLRLLEAVGRAAHPVAPPVRVLHGEPATAIMDHLERTGTNLLVIGARHGAGASTGVGRGLLYSAPCAVLAIPI